MISETIAPMIVVSGLPRSGTSLMMQILESANISILSDRIRIADYDNPEGYYEYERVKQLNKGDHSWLLDAQGKAVKVISALIPYLPYQYKYQVIFMLRDIKEVIASQRKMQIRLGEPVQKVNDDILEAIFAKHLRQIQDHMSQCKNISVLYIDYNQLVATPILSLQKIAEFLDLDTVNEHMIQAVNPLLYRNRRV